MPGVDTVISVNADNAKNDVILRVLGKFGKLRPCQTYCSPCRKESQWACSRISRVLLLQPSVEAFVWLQMHSFPCGDRGNSGTSRHLKKPKT